MKPFLLLFLCLPSFFIIAQESDFYKLPNGEEYMSTVINLKIRPEFRSSCSKDAIGIAELSAYFKTLGAISVEKKFPTTTAPSKPINARGQAMMDLSLIYKLNVPFGTDVLTHAAELAKMRFVEYAEPQFVSQSHYVPNDERLNAIMPYHYDNIKAYQAWDITLGDTNVVIGITETAIYNLHPDFVDNIKYNYADPIGNGDDDGDGYVDNYAGWDVVDNDNDPFRNGEIHGDAVTGIASATADNDLGYAGIGFKCKFIPVKVGNNTGVITHGYEGIQYCVEKGCSIVNCSWGNKTFSQVAQDVVTWAAVNNDVVLVASAGNENSEALYYPASYAHVLSVTGVNATDIFEGGANTFSRNDSVDVSAPAINVYTTAYYGGNVLYSPPQGGTSMAAPIVSGVAALVRSQFPCLHADEVIEKIRLSADPIDGLVQNAPYAGLIGTGRVNAQAAVTGNLCDPVGIQDSDRTASLDVYPNPTAGVVNLRMGKTSNWTVQVMDLHGRMIIEKQHYSDRTTLSALVRGMYVVRVSDGKDCFYRKLSVIAE